MNCRTIEAIALSSRKSSPSASRQAVSESREMYLTDHLTDLKIIEPWEIFEWLGHYFEADWRTGVSCFGFVTLFGFSVSILGFRIFVLGLCVLVLFPSAVVLPNDITTHKLSGPKSGDFKMSATSVKRARNVLTVANKPDYYSPHALSVHQIICYSKQAQTRKISFSLNGH